MGALLLALLLTVEAEAGGAARCIEATCKVYGRYVKCQSVGADGLDMPIWVYHSTPQYEVHGYGSGMVQITEKPCTQLIFYATETSTSRTFTAEVQVRLDHGRATFEGCPNRKKE